MLIQLLEKKVTRVIELHTVKKYSGQKPHAKEIHTHKSYSESTKVHYALSLKNTLSNRCAIQELNGRHVISFGKSKTISSWRKKLVSDAVFKQIPGGVQKETRRDIGSKSDE